MKFALLVTATPFSTEGANTALRFACAAIDSGHTIERIFFFRDGVHNASHFSTMPQDEKNVPEAWQQFCDTHRIDTVVCISAALKRGITKDNIHASMQISGLGLLTDAIINADRVLTFG